MEDKGLIETLKENNELLLALLGNDRKVKKLRKKEFKLPFFKTFGTPAKIKKGMCLVQTILNNGSMDINWHPIEDGIVKLKNGLSYPAVSKYIINYRNKPWLIIPEWSEKPFSPAEQFQEVFKDGELSYPQRLLGELAERKAAKLEVKKKFGKVWLFVIIGVVLLVLAYIIFSGGGLNSLLSGLK